MPKLCRKIVFVSTKKRIFVSNLSIVSIMDNKARTQKLVKFFCHTFFIISLFLCFENYSFLRPAPYKALYKEYIAAFILVMMLYINYLIFIPKFYLKRNFSLFIFLSLISVFVATTLEMVIIAPDIVACMPTLFSEQEIRSGIVIHSFLVGFRNIAFLLFFFVLRIFEHERETLEKERIALAKNKGFICVPNGKDDMRTISISDISYILHERNYTYIHTIDGSRYCKYCSLSSMEELLPENLFLRVSRNTIISINIITRFTDDSVTILYGNPAQEISFTLSENYVPDVKEILNSVGGLNCSVGGLNSQNGGLKDRFGGLNEGIDMANLEEFMDNIAHDEDLLNLCRIIAKDPSVTTKSLSEQLHIPLRTIERKIKYLKDNGVLQHNGAKKNGGYAFSPSVFPIVLNWLTGEHNN